MTPQPWLPISTAPQDGSWILLYDPTSHHKVYTGMWDESFSYSWPSGESIGAWTSSIAECFATEQYQQLHPTHWMPLPQAVMNLEERDAHYKRHPEAPGERDLSKFANNPLADAVVALVGNQPVSATRDTVLGITTLKYDTTHGGPLSVRIVGPEGRVSEVALQAPNRPAETIYHTEALAAIDYWGWNWVRRSARLAKESYLEMVQDALKKVAQ